VEKTNVEGVIQTTHQYSIKPDGKWPPTHTTEEHKTGAEKNKLRATALGRSVADYLYRDFNDLFAYTFTAAMEAQLDDVSKGTLPWKSVLSTTWNTYKDRYETATKGGAKASAAARSRQLAEGIKVVLSKKGPLFVKEETVSTENTVTTGKAKPKPKAKGKNATFAPLKPGMSFDTVTEADAIAAFGAAAGTQLGAHDGKLIVKKTGRYGAYVEWGSIKIPFKVDDTLPQLVERLTAKATAAETPTYSRIVGDFTIRSGPYGLYFFKHALKRVTFVKLPAGVDSATVTATDLATHYSNGLKRKTATGYKKKAKSDAEPEK
jgi:DNA topoisomerase-1